MKLRCFLFGHKWKYGERLIRGTDRKQGYLTCLRCGKVHMLSRHEPGDPAIWE